ncbi:MAG: PTS sugar transporter subunit IIC [bacterium]|nr:PTS sugar transporter subunit IIC [bacterium]
MDILKILEVALIGGLIGLDRLAVGQFMISQPIVAAPLVGWVLGSFHTGLLVGVVFELFWLRGLPVGGHVPKNDTLAAILIVALALLPLSQGSDPDPAWIAWVLLAVVLLLDPLGFVEQWVRRQNRRLTHVAETSAVPEAGLLRAIGMGLTIFFLYNFLVVSSLLVVLPPLVQSSFSWLSATVREGLRFFLFLLPAMGVAVLLTRKDPMRGRILPMAGLFVSLVLLLTVGRQPEVMVVVLTLGALATVLGEQHLRQE